MYWFHNCCCLKDARCCLSHYCSFHCYYHCSMYWFRNCCCLKGTRCCLSSIRSFGSDCYCIHTCDNLYCSCSLYNYTYRNNFHHCYFRRSKDLEDKISEFVLRGLHLDYQIFH